MAAKGTDGPLNGPPGDPPSGQGKTKSKAPSEPPDDGGESLTAPSFAQTVRKVWAFRRYCLGFLVPALGVLLIALVQADLLLSATSTSQALLDRLATGVDSAQSPSSPAPSAPAAGIASGLLRLLLGDAPPSAATLALLLVPLLLLAGVTKIFAELARTVLNNRLRTRIQIDLLAGLGRQTGENRTLDDAASALSALSQDASSVGMLLVFGILRIVETLVQLGVYAYGMWKIPGGVAVLAVVVPASILFNGILVKLFLRRENVAVRASEGKRLEANNLALELMALLPKLVSFAGEKRISEQVVERFRVAGKANVRFQWISSIRAELVIALSTLTLPIVALILIRSDVTPGVIIQAQGLVTLILGGITSLLSLPSMITSYAPAIDRLDGILQVPRIPPAPAALSSLAKADTTQPLYFRDVTFGYPGAERDVLRGIDLEIPPGASVGIVGMPGCGKSTLAKLVTGDWRPQSGQILYGDLDLTPLHPIQRRDLIAFLPDDPGFLTGTLGDNIRFGRDLDDEAVQEAVEASGARRVVNEKGGLDCMISSRDTGLSGGQRRLLGVARLVAGHQPVLIFDEPGAQLSGEDIRTVAKSLRDACSGRTAIIITHDPDVFLTDFNVFLHEGRVEATGTHDELRQRHPRYRDLVERDRSEELPREAIPPS